MESRGNRVQYKKVLVGFLYAFVLLISLAFGSLMGWIGQSETLVGVVKKDLFNIPPKEAFGNRSSVTLLILGVDDIVSVNQWGAKVKSSEGARSDMMMVARMDFDGKSIGAVSIPRDTLCRVSGYRKRKINAYHAIGGPELSAEAVESLLPGVKIDRVVVLNFDAFVDMVDMVGGVEMYVPKDMKYDDDWGDVHIDLKKGRQDLDGYNALMFARMRHSDSDFERQKRQKDLMMALKGKVVQNVIKAPEMLNKVLELAGRTFDADEMSSMITFLKSVDNENIKMGQVPVVEVPGSFDLEIDGSQLDNTLAEFKVVVPRYSFARVE